MTLGKIIAPNILPSTPPIIVAKKEYIKYLITICLLENPKDFSVPISVRSSSTILFIDTKLIKHATAKNKSGKILAKLAILPVSSTYSVYVK